MRIYRIADRRHPIWDGTGAALVGGRWNSPGHPAIYGSLSHACAMLEILGSAALTLGLLCVGAGLEPGRLGRNPPALVAANMLKLVVMPVATWGFCRLLGVEDVTAATAVLFTAAPVSASSYVLARQLGGDAPLMAALITVSTIVAALTMPLALAMLT